MLQEGEGRDNASLGKLPILWPLLIVYDQFLIIIIGSE
jgi:hypothetical protein